MSDVRFAYDYAVDTALSYEDSFPELDDDLFVEIGSPLGDFPVVLVSARYTAPDIGEAAALAVDLVDELNGDFTEAVHWPGSRPAVWVFVYDAAGDKLRDCHVVFNYDDGEWQVND